MNEKPPIFRFAPSPNGELHLGHAYSALLNLKLAREMGGKMLLRIEDIDTQRCTAELETQMLKDLEWIGFQWDEAPLRQSERFDLYKNALDQLTDQGLLYPATLSRSAIKNKIAQTPDWPHDPDGSPHYPGSERNLSKTQKLEILTSEKTFSLRMDMAKTLAQINEELHWLEGEALAKIIINPAQWGDVVLARKDTPTSYHISSVVDDHEQGITHIVRGKDLYQATSMHVLLQSLLGFKTPQYHHHDLIMDEGQKLSKSNKSTSLYQLRQSGITPTEVRQMISIYN